MAWHASDGDIDCKYKENRPQLLSYRRDHKLQADRAVWEIIVMAEVGQSYNSGFLGHMV